MSIGNRIVKLRKERGWTQSGLAQLAKLSASAIAMYETDRRTPDAASLVKLAGVFEMKPEALLSEQPDAQKGTEQVGHDGALEDSGNQTDVGHGQVQEVGDLVKTISTSQADLPEGTTQLALTREEARIILFLRMNPQAMPFLQSYITAGNQRRMQLEKTWRLINEFQQ